MSGEKELRGVLGMKELRDVLGIIAGIAIVVVTMGSVFLRHEPTLAAVVLIISIIAASTTVAVAVYLWFTRVRTGATGAAQAVYTASKLQIVGASLSSAPKTSTVYVQNIGNVNANLTMALLIDPATQNAICSNVLNQVIPAGSAASITISWDTSCNIKPGYTYVIELVTKDGAMFTTQLAAS